ncbi:unnamed protein product [Meloidogyne enterolobii]|uniref:Uncharacterized protein n=1 Tax=Meloidogyne enterolobii TaxID=390850 RepID=A0ACB0Y412_MELEN
MTKTLTNQIEKVQKFYTLHALRKCKRSKIAYQDRLKIFDLESLSLRRTLYDLTLIYKIINHFTSINPKTLITFSSRTKRNKHKQQIQILRKTSKTENWIINRCTNTWNSLPENIINSKTPKQFWILLKNHLLKAKEINNTFIYY